MKHIANMSVCIYSIFVQWRASNISFYNFFSVLSNVANYRNIFMQWPITGHKGVLGCSEKYIINIKIKI